MDVDGKEDTSISLVVVGSMDPSIHHPTWYHLIGLLEADVAADAAKGALCNPQLARFQTQTLQVTCLPNRWQVGSRESFDFLCDFTGAVFDTHLKHTLMSALGVNYHFHRRTGALSVGQWLANAVRDIGLSAKDMHVDVAEFRYRLQYSGYPINVTLQESMHSKTNVYAEFNVHGQLKDRQDVFDVAPLLREAHQSSLPAIVRSLEQIVKAIGEG